MATTFCVQGCAVIAFAEAVDPAKTLGHALVSGEVADQIIGRDIYSHFTRAGGNEENGTFIDNIF